jgi:hypothetical protein
LHNILVGATKAALAAAAIVAATLCAAPAALAKTTTSSNWAGYAVHHPGVSFRQVSGTWTQPNATCIPGQSTYSAVWVGIGGYKPTSNALEQIGTEVDCNRAGNTVSSAWYELARRRAPCLRHRPRSSGDPRARQPDPAPHLP